MNNILKKLILYQMESITSNSQRRNNNDTINLTTSNNRSVSKYSDLTVGVVHYNMESFGEN
jgi:hypothetical protein